MSLQDEFQCNHPTRIGKNIIGLSYDNQNFINKYFGIDTSTETTDEYFITKSDNKLDLVY